MIFTTSWDDGHPLDLRLAELLRERGFTGTFYVPIRNREGLPVLPPSGIRTLDAAGEVASHTRDHCYLTTVDDDTARRQIREGRSELEQIVGHAVGGFAYPGGAFRPVHRAMVESESFDYARTTVNLRIDAGHDRLAMPTTLQLYPHRRGVYLRNWLRRGSVWQRAALALRGASAPDLGALLRASLLHAKTERGVFHLWGHSWELDAFGGWKLLDEFLRFAADHVPPRSRVVNRELVALA